MTARIEFSAGGSLRGMADAIEQYARAQGRVNALVVPWESTAMSITMAVTSVKADGWAIEHTNLGTIRLTDLHNDLVAVAISAAVTEPPALASIFERFARDLERHLTARPSQTSSAGQP
jgi:hypothetical protein